MSVSGARTGRRVDAKGRESTPVVTGMMFAGTFTSTDPYHYRTMVKVRGARTYMNGDSEVAQNPERTQAGPSRRGFGPDLCRRIYQGVQINPGATSNLDVQRFLQERGAYV